VPSMLAAQGHARYVSARVKACELGRDQVEASKLK